MGGLSDEYKYPKSPYLQRTMDNVDRLEDRMALADANARRPLDSTSNQTIEGDMSMPYVKKAPGLPKPLVANDFKKYIGEIVNDTYEDRYVEVVGVVGDLVAVKTRPGNYTPEFKNPSSLMLF